MASPATQIIVSSVTPTVTVGPFHVPRPIPARALPCLADWGSPCWRQSATRRLGAAALRQRWTSRQRPDSPESLATQPANKARLSKPAFKIRVSARLLRPVHGTTACSFATSWGGQLALSWPLNSEASRSAVRSLQRYARRRPLQSTACQCVRSQRRAPFATLG